jgi:hypothetical protein
MGVSLILLGVMLLSVSFAGIEAMDAFMAWWPLVLVLTGLEMIAYIVFAGKENPVIRYDLFSIFFVGVFACLALAMTLLTSAGLLGEVRAAVQTYEWTGELPAAQMTIPPDVERIVINTQHHPARIDRAGSDQLHVFGTYRVMAAPEHKDELIPKEDVVDLRRIGSTLYVTAVNGVEKLGFREERVLFDLTIVVPERLEVEWNGMAMEATEAVETEKAVQMD